MAGGLAVYLLPKLATDAKIDLPEHLKGLSSKNAKTEIPKIAAAITKALDGKLAKDATLADIGKQMDAMADMPMEEGADADPNSGLPMSAEELKKQTMDEAETKKMDFLKSKLSAEDMKAWDAMCAGEGEDETPEEAAAREAKGKGVDEDPEKKPMTKGAMDAALKKLAADSKTATDKAVKDTIDRMNAISEAREAVQPYVGKLAVAFDSAEGVYVSALKTLGVAEDELKDLPLAALKTVLKHQDTPDKVRGKQPLAFDAAGADSFAKMYPDASRIGIQG
jgi:hypothetical protein